MTASEWAAAGLDWQWLCEALARLGWENAALENIRAARANGAHVDVKKIREEFESCEGNRFV